jgi:hypothetical protein
MRDYKVTTFRDGDIGIYVESDWAAARGWKVLGDGMIEIFRTREAALRFVHEGEAEGYTFKGKTALGINRRRSRPRNGR